jgi:ABC-2 type transport system permease protein
MNRHIVVLTARQLIERRRTLLVVLGCALPVLIAVIYRLSSDRMDPQEFTAGRLLPNLAVGTLLPLVALVFGAAALGSEIDDGTAVYILSKPIPRWRIALSKLVVAWGATAILLVVSTVASGTIALWGSPQAGIVGAWALAALAVSLVYTAAFLALSVFTSRALVAGLVYVFLWEQIITRLFRGTRFLSVREYGRSIADAVMTTNRELFTVHLSTTEALVFAGLVTALALALAIRKLERFEVGETG